MSEHRYDASKRLEVGLGWEKKQKVVDLDIQCVAFDALGVVVDACFFNNLKALNGAITLSGDCADGETNTGGADETITLHLKKMPPHVATIICAVFCASPGSTLADVSDLHVSVHDPIAKKDIFTLPAQGDLTATTGYVPIQLTKDFSFKQEWIVAVQWEGLRFQNPVRDFVAAIPLLQGSLGVSPETQAAAASQQPVFNLKKGQTYDMPIGLNQIGFGLGWDSHCDLDASLVALSSANPGKPELVFFGKLTGLNGAVRHGGDNLTGEGDGDDETIYVDLEKIPAHFTHLFIMVTIYTMNKNFDDVDGEFIRVYNDLGVKKKEFLRYDTLDDAGPVNGVIVGCLTRQKNMLAAKVGVNAVADGWGFTAMNVGAKGNTCHALVDECQDLMKLDLDMEAYYRLPHRAAEQQQFRAEAARKAGGRHQSRAVGGGGYYQNHYGSSSGGVERMPPTLGSMPRQRSDVACKCLIM